MPAVNTGRRHFASGAQLLVGQAHHRITRGAVRHYPASASPHPHGHKPEVVGPP